MADYRDNPFRQGTVAGSATQADIDQGLRSYMLRVYNYMALALGVTGVAALGTANIAMNNPEIAQLLYGSAFRYVIMFAPLIFVIALGAGYKRFSYGTLAVLFVLFSVVMGLSFSYIFWVFSMTSIITIFFCQCFCFCIGDYALHFCFYCCSVDGNCYSLFAEITKRRGKRKKDD